MTCSACAVIYKPRAESSQTRFQPNNYHRRSVITEIFSQAPGVFKHPQEIESIGIGLLSHHRSGIVFPEYIALFTGSDEAHLSLKETMHIPNAPCEKEIVKKDFVFSVKESIGCFRIIVHRYAKMPQWCTYKGVCDVFTLADHLIIKPKEK